MIRVVFFGTPDFAVPSLKRLLAHPEFKVLGVVTQPDRRRGRGSRVIAAPVKQVAIAANLPVWQPASLKRDAELLAQLRSLAADTFVVVAYGQILSQEILDLPRLGCINCHGSILPKYRGAAPIQWALYHGEAETGITTMLMDAGMDTGAMLLKTYLSVELLANHQAVASTLAGLGADLLIETLLKLEQIQPVPQDSFQATYAPLIRKQDYGLNWLRPALQLHNQVRGFYPNCVTLFRGSLLKVTATIPLGSDYWSSLPADLQTLKQDCSESQAGVPGQVLRIARGFGPIIRTGEGELLLRQVQLTGKRPQSGWDFVNGVRLAVGEILGSS